MLTLVFQGTGLAGTEKVLYAFQNGPDGARPAGPLTFDPNGNIYGTTTDGGLQVCSGFDGCGVVYELSKSSTGWTEAVLYSFAGGNDGFQPYTGVIFDTLGNLYGGTGSGGNAGCYGGSGCGAVIELSPLSGTWTETTLYTFTGGTDAGASLSPLEFDGKGNLRSTARFGGNGVYGACYWGSGAIFELTPSGSGWTDNTLYSFNCGPDGGDPYSSRKALYKGNFYGSTTGGGSGFGTIFELEHSGGVYNEVVLYSFTGGSDGAYPYSYPILDGAGNIYGTTYYGGAYGNGVVYKLTRSGSGWTETVLYNFTGGADGSNPESGLTLDSAGNIYGTTQFGGAGYGVVFELQNSGGVYAYNNVYTFSGGLDGAEPAGDVTLRGSHLFGTTYLGGSAGVGVVYRIKL